MQLFLQTVNPLPAVKLPWRYSSCSPWNWKILPYTSTCFESWLYCNTSSFVTYSALHFPQPFCCSLPLLWGAFIRNFYSHSNCVQLQTWSGFSLFHIWISNAPEVFKICDYVAHKSLVLQYFHPISSNTFWVLVPLPFLSPYISVFTVDSVWAALQGSCSKLSSQYPITNYFSPT